MNSNRQQGFTLTELMISTVLSLSVIGAVLMSYVATSTSAVGTLAASKLNHELTSLMSLMTNDIRRAGYWGTLAGLDNPAINPFSVVGQSAMTVFLSAGSTVSEGTTGAGACLVYAYDMNSNGVVDAGELTGFRLNNGVVQMRTSGIAGSLASCGGVDNVWEDLTDLTHITTTALNFDLAESACLNSREPDDLDNDGNGVIDNPEETDCYAAPLPVTNSNDVTVETREVKITLEGMLADDSFVRVTQSQSVRVRNELIRVH